MSGRLLPRHIVTYSSIVPVSHRFDSFSGNSIACHSLAQIDICLKQLHRQTNVKARSGNLKTASDCMQLPRTHRICSLFAAENVRLHSMPSAQMRYSHHSMFRSFNLSAKATFVTQTFSVFSFFFSIQHIYLYILYIYISISKRGESSILPQAHKDPAQT